jgi:hypothetical protein
MSLVVVPAWVPLHRSPFSPAATRGFRKRAACA